MRLLTVHETAEEEVTHPIARREIADGESVVQARLGEEADAKDRLAELYKFGVDHRDFDAKLDALASAVLRHAEREEEVEFPGLRRRLSPQDLTKLVGALETTEATAPTRPHPLQVNRRASTRWSGHSSPTFDRVRDRVSGWSWPHRNT